jgi:predicted acylesterase/phospholipase RssA
MAVLDRLDDLERFLLDLRPEAAFRPNRLWRLPLLGLHEYALPETIAERFGDLRELAEELTRAERELVVFASDVTETEQSTDDAFELVYSSQTTPPGELAQAILASAAISTLVLPLRVGDRIATDGAWTRNFPLGPAYDRPEVGMIVAFRYLPRYPRFDATALRRLRRRLRPFRRVAPVRALIAELEEGPKAPGPILEAGSVITGIANDPAGSNGFKSKAVAWRAWLGTGNRKREAGNRRMVPHPHSP